MSAVADPRGLKRICNGCGARFYDMNKRPIVCPSCGVAFTGEIQVKNRRSRIAAATEGQVEEKTAKDTSGDEEGEIEAEADVVSLEDAETTDTEGEEDEVAGDLNLDDIDADSDDEDGDDLEGLEGDVDLTTDKED